MVIISKQILCHLCCLALLVLFPLQAKAVTVEITPGISNVSVGEDFTIDVNISGLENDNLSEFWFWLGYDHTVIGLDAYVLGSDLDDGYFQAFDLSWGDSFTVALEYLDYSSQPDSFLLLSLNFSAFSEGLTDIVLGGLILYDDAYPNNEITYSANDAVVQISGVPEPSSVMLFLMGFMGFSFFGRAKKS